MGVDTEVLRALHFQMEQEESAMLDRVVSVFSFRFAPGGIVERLVLLSTN